MIAHQKLAEWRGKELVDWDGERIGKLRLLQSLDPA